MEQLRIFLKSDIGICVALYLFLGITAWAANGILSTHLVIKDLTDIFVWVFAQLTATHGINSVFNSPRGIHPDQGGT